MLPTTICLRHGYGNCKCEYCLPWIARWEKEIDGFALFNKLKEENKPLFIIFERMRAEYTEVLATHHVYLEEKYIEHKFNLPPINPLVTGSNPSPKTSTKSSDSFNPTSP